MSTIPYVVAKNLHNTVLGNTQQDSCCPTDNRTPNLNTVVYGTGNGYSNISGVLESSNYGFTDNGYVVNSCSGLPVPNNSLFARIEGPIYGATIGNCVSRGSQSKILNYAGDFSPLPSTMARKCFS